MRMRELAAVMAGVSFGMAVLPNMTVFAADNNMDYRRKVVGIAGIMNNTSTGLNDPVTRAEFEDGSYLGAGWQRIEANWYLLDDQGYRLTGWQERDGKRYYLGENGEMATGWFVWNDNWYYADKSGVMQTGWIMTEPGKYYYMDENGVWVEDAVKNEE